ncbi:alkene reductase [Streptomyces spectabilis]|uniref:Alkene reductase n=1 Tax=Streptomyces spectabilis TaxID=68270 RepID=A0A5P2X2R7_STRST|nr:alkene reductase [Streptomyces spectabilis]MBB5108923.1 N-ethylmaleimide reductase [Streptomyces spectabilis]MCI3899785.1 alkene reductase [Streptomyces spectabilis]QEV57455.1 alkene reductase [Streptomyces spectabilis]GGV42949.1 alkene reductase [Streptomyces spectabilis]
MTTAFAPIVLGSLTLPNRIAMAPLTRRRAYGEGLSATALMTEYYVQRSTAGLIIAEALQPSRVGQGYTDTPGLHDERQVRSWRPITDAVHAADGRIYAQLMHAGRNSHPELLGDGLHPVAPSPVAADGMVRISSAEPAVRKPYPAPHELSITEVRETIEDFAQAAHNAIRAGFDGVELHGAYGYLIQQFLSDNANHRNDRYGGSIAGRIRFVLELVDAVAARIGPRRLALRISPGCPAFGLTETDVDDLYPALVSELRGDLAYLHIFEFPGHRALTRRLRAAWPSVFMLNPHETPESWPAGPGDLHLIEDGLADILAFGTLYISNPDLVRRLRTGGAVAPADQATFYRGDHRGYTDYPALTEAGVHATP